MQYYSSLRLTRTARHTPRLLAALLLGSAVLTGGCGHKSAEVVPQSKADETAARIQTIKNNPQLSDSQKQQQIQRLQAESKP